jgi:hypothetical protein
MLLSWRLERLVFFDLVFFLDLVAKRIFRLAFYLGFVVIDLHFFLVFLFSHDGILYHIRLKAIVENLTATYVEG